MAIKQLIQVGVWDPAGLKGLQVKHDCLLRHEVQMRTAEEVWSTA